MAITNYGELKTAVANWLSRSDLTARIPEFICLAEDRIALDRRIRIRAMETTTDLAISSQSTPLPANYLGARRLYLEGNEPRLEFLPPEDFWIRQLSIETGTPKFFTAEGDNLLVGPAPGSPVTGKLLYWKRFARLTLDTDTNWLLSNAAGIYLYGTLLEAEPFIGDDARALTWSTLWDDEVDKLKEADKFERYSGAPLRTRSDVHGW